MILLVHMLFGAAIGSTVNNFYLAVILAFLGHYFLDTFPHVEYLDSVESSIQKKSGHDVMKVLLDFLIGIFIIFLFSKNHPIIYICALIAIIPDGLTVISKLFPNKLSLLHDKIHYLTKQKNFPKFWKITMQVLAVIISIIFLKM